jgi:hypothetical protein
MVCLRKNIPRILARQRTHTATLTTTELGSYTLALSSFTLSAAAWYPCQRWFARRLLQCAKTNALAALLRLSFGTRRCWRRRAAAADAIVSEDCMFECRHLVRWIVERAVREKVLIVLRTSAGSGQDIGSGGCGEIRRSHWLRFQGWGWCYSCAYQHQQSLNWFLGLVSGNERIR